MVVGRQGHISQKGLKKRINEDQQITNIQVGQIHTRFIGPFEKQKNFKISSKHYLNSVFAL